MLNLFGKPVPQAVPAAVRKPYDCYESKLGRRFLKVKLKSLAAEARIIRLEESRSAGELHDLLHHHRVFDVRSEARATGLAYAFIRGRTFAQTEPKSARPPAVDRVIAMVKRYGWTPTYEKDLEAWFAARSLTG